MTRAKDQSIKFWEWSGSRIQITILIARICIKLLPDECLGRGIILWCIFLNVFRTRAGFACNSCGLVSYESCSKLFKAWACALRHAVIDSLQLFEKSRSPLKFLDSVSPYFYLIDTTFWSLAPISHSYMPLWVTQHFNVLNLQLLVPIIFVFFIF